MSITQDYNNMYIYIWAAVKINCWSLVRKYKLSLFWGGPIAFQCFFQITLNNAKMKHVWLQASIQLGMDLGALHLCVCNHVGKISKRIPRLFQWFPTVVKSLILWKRKRVISPFAKPWRQKAPHFPAQKLKKVKMGPHSSKKRSACIYEEVLEAIQVSKQPGGLGLRACLFSSLNSSCWDQMGLALLRGSSCNKRLSLGYR